MNSPFFADMRAKLNKPIIIMPVSIPGLFVFHALKREGIQINGFCDNDRRKQGVVYDGVEVFAPQKAYKLFPNAVVIICAIEHEKSIRFQLSDIGFSDLMRCESIIDYAGSYDALNDINHDEINRLLPTVALKMPNSAQIISINHCPKSIRDNKDAVIIPQMNFCITQRCTLKCRDCMNLIQYHKEPRDSELDIVIKSIYSLSAVVDYIGLIWLLGGEPLLHKDLPDIIEKVESLKNINSVGIVTNGTILPTEKTLFALRKSNATVAISKYKDSKKINELIDILKNYSINFYISDLPSWYETCKIVDGSDRTEKDLQVMYDDCNAKACISLSGNRLYHCPFLVGAYELGAIPYEESDFIDLDKVKDKAEIRKYLGNDLFFQGCRNCSGGYNSKGKDIPIALQIKEPLPYKRYT